MTSLFMGTLVTGGVPADEKAVRNTATPAMVDAPAAMQKDMPEQQEVETDPNPDLGMSPRQLASKFIPPVKYAPFWRGQVDDQDDHNRIIDKQVSTSGTAAAREAAGKFGHGTAPVTIGIEPVQDLQDGHKMGDDYFHRENREVQATMDAAMTVPPDYDHSVVGDVQAAGKINARAASASAYNKWWNGGN